MATITASLERSLQKCSLSGGGVGPSRASNSSDYHHQSKVNNHNLPDHHSHENQETVTTASSSYENSTFVELNSHISLPYHWEQCLDLKTGEIYYINWSNRMKVREDPRTTTAGGYNNVGDDYEEEEEEDEDEDEDDDEEEEVKNNNAGYESEGSSTESHTLRSSQSLKKLVMGYGDDEEISKESSVLVVAGCKSCLMYHMVPKHQQICPKCCAHLLHFPPTSTSTS